MGSNQGNHHPGKMNTWGWLLNKYGSKTAEELEKVDKSKLPVKEVACVNLIKQFLIKNNLQALNMWMEREEGKAKQLTETRDLTAEDSPIYKAIKEIKNGA